MIISFLIIWSVANTLISVIFAVVLEKRREKEAENIQRITAILQRNTASIVDLSKVAEIHTQTLRGDKKIDITLDESVIRELTKRVSLEVKKELHRQIH